MRKINTYKGVIMSYDCNAYGHMSMTQFIDKFDQAGRRFFLEMGFQDQLQGTIGIVAVEQKTNYLKEALEGDLIDINSHLIEIGNKVFKVSHEMINAYSGELMSTMIIVFALFDKKLKKSILIPKDKKEKIYQKMLNG